MISRRKLPYLTKAFDCVARFDVAVEYSWKPIVSLFASWGRFDLFTRHLDIYRLTVAEWTGALNDAD
jgi:hypothetical protein